MFECQDFAWAGIRMPVTIKHLYNSALGGYQYSRNDAIKLQTADFSAMNIGLGWKLNVMQSMVPTTFQHEGELTYGYVYIGENGEEVYFKQSEKTGQFDDGTSYNLFESVTDSGILYDPQKHSLVQGDEAYQFDAMGRLVGIANRNSLMRIN